jgi:hypothetical protein
MGIWKPVPAGSVFGRLTTLTDREAGSRTIPCRCSCGNAVDAPVAGLFAGWRKSCGCLHVQHATSLKARHGMAGTKIYNIWADMVARCTRATHPRFDSYGGRGITVCERWRTFENFYADMGDRPEGRSLDRRDNDAGYSPENCRWATAVEQRANRRPQRRSTYCGYGHPYGEDAPRNRNGSRRCRPCERRHAKAKRERAAA